ncbi:glycosyltransferase [Helicobacter pullorum]|uniref:glycosyltransferase n=1 Tax=Helicobacter pullorum TaxID=35818 RepID=UPI0009E2EDD9|nr:glycosyltransferase [Helicobacter pullorum]
MKNKNCAVLLGANEDYSVFVANVLLGLKRYSEEIIDNVIIFHDFKETTSKNIESIMPGKILLRKYLFEDFLKDVGGDISGFPSMNRFTYFIYVKFYVYEILRDYDYVIWLDADTLVIDDVTKLIAVDDFDYMARGAKHGNYLIKEYLEKVLNIWEFNDGYIALKEGVIVASKNIASKIGSGNLTRQCFEHLKNIYKYGLLKTLSGSDFIPMNLVVYLHGFNYKILGGFADTWQFESHKDSCVIHMSGGGKPLKDPFDFISYQEWYVNYKIWRKINGDARNIELNNSNLKINSNHELYIFLKKMNSLLPLMKHVSLVLNQINLLGSFLYITSDSNLRIVLGDEEDFFVQISPGFYPWSVDARLTCHFGRIEYNELLKFSIDKEYQVLKHSKATILSKTINVANISLAVREIKNILDMGIGILGYESNVLKELELKNQELIQTKNQLDSTKKELDSKVKQMDSQIKNLESSQNQSNLKIQRLTEANQQLDLKNQQLTQTNSRLNLKAKELNFTLRYGTAKSRIHNHLSYKLGQAMIENSKSLLGYIRMPYVLSYIKDKHKQEQQQYQEAIKKNPNLKLPNLESYPDYKESLKEKECFTYKLGEALMKADKTWYKGGYVALMFEVRKLKDEI